MATKPRGGGLKALVAGPLRNELFFAASLGNLIFRQYFLYNYVLTYDIYQKKGFAKRSHKNEIFGPCHCPSHTFGFFFFFLIFKFYQLTEKGIVLGTRSVPSFAKHGSDPHFLSFYIFVNNYHLFFIAGAGKVPLEGRERRVCWGCRGNKGPRQGLSTTDWTSFNGEFPGSLPEGIFIICPRASYHLPEWNYSFSRRHCIIFPK